MPSDPTYMAGVDWTFGLDSDAPENPCVHDEQHAQEVARRLPCQVLAGGNDPNFPLVNAYMFMELKPTDEEPFHNAPMGNRVWMLTMMHPDGSIHDLKLGVPSHEFDWIVALLADNDVRI